jgi:hypothetical protein
LQGLWMGMGSARFARNIESGAQNAIYRSG